MDNMVIHDDEAPAAGVVGVGQYYFHRWLQGQETEDGSGGNSGSGSSGNDALATFSAVMTNLLLFMLIFCLSATVDLKDLKHQLTNKFAIGTGVTMQFVLMPFLGFLSVVAFTSSGFTQPMGVSLLVVTASPGGSYSNWWCSLFNASLALSVGMTTVSSLLSIGLLPANLMLWGWLAYGVVLEGDDVNIVGALDFGAIFITLGVVMGAIITGLYVGHKYNNPTFHRRSNYVGSISGIALILFSVFLGSGAGDTDTNFWSLPWSFYVATAFPCLVGMSLANIIARSFTLPYPEIVAISIECCYQNTAIATSVAVTMFSDPTARAEAVSVPLFYGVVEAVIIGLYCLWAWKAGWTKAPSDEKLCVVMMRAYEVQDEENDNDNDIDVGFDPEASRELTWWQKCYVPKYATIHDHHKPAREHTSTDKEGEADDKNDETRNRFYSADITVHTNLTTPPGTPDVAAGNNVAEVSSDAVEEDPENGSAAVAPTTSVRPSSRSVLTGNMLPAVIVEGEEDSSLDGSTPRTRPAISTPNNTLMPILDSSDTTPQRAPTGSQTLMSGMTSQSGAPCMPGDDDKSDGGEEDVINA